MHLIFLWIILALFWSGSYTAVKIGLDGFGPFTMVAARLLIGAGLLYLILRLRSGHLPLNGRALLAYTVPAVFGNLVPFLLIGFGEIHVDSGLAALLMGIAPVATVFLAPLLIPDEHLTPRSLFGVGFGIGGLLVLVGATALSGLGQHVTGQLAILGAALCYAGTTLYVRRWIALPPLQMATGSLVVGAIPATVGAFMLEQPFSAVSAYMAPILAILYLGVCSTAIATLIYFYLVPHLGAGRMQQINFMVPAVGTLFGVALLGEPLEAKSLVALSLITVAVYLVTSARRHIPTVTPNIQETS
ncbi:DMT family transporter [Nisaea nitritireducens]|uniref:DMT family transporter n=1 Tax=Nisaea nitritireducens TaxID=568392 RepID=UPI00186815D2|nr:DMT family transporter [Nisaea nitritireducens]